MEEKLWAPEISLMEFPGTPLGISSIVGTGPIATFQKQQYKRDVPHLAPSFPLFLK